MNQLLRPSIAAGTVVRRLSLLMGVMPVCAAVVAGAGHEIRFAGAPVELVLSQVSDRTVRIQLLPLEASGIRRSPERSTVLVPFETTETFRARDLEAEEVVEMGGLSVIVKPRPLRLSIRRADGEPVQELAFDEALSSDTGVSFQTKAMVLGLGEGAQQFDRRGALYPMEPGWGAWNRPVLGSVVPSPFLIGTDGWAMFVHQPEGQFDLREGKGRFIPMRPEAATNTAALADHTVALDLFVVGVEKPADALKEYIELTGRPVMPPKWALGYMQSHRTLAGPEEPIEIAQTFRRKRLPCDALIYLGTGYCTNGWNTGHGSLTFNPNAFVPANIARLHDMHFKVVFHVNRAPRNLYGSFSDPPQAVPPEVVGQQEESTGGSGREAVPVRDYWSRHRELCALGVDGWWPDDGDELPLAARLTRHRCYYQGPLDDRPNTRPWSLHRTGYAGAQRYGGWIWSGDIDSKWETLAAQVSVGLNHGLSLTPFWGTDTGGFFPSPELTGELYVRWFQFSTFCPSFRSHGRTWKLRLPWGWNTGEFGPQEHPERLHPDRSELHNAQVEPICRTYLELRYRLLPYNYTLARESSDTGLPMMRALWLHYPDDSEAVKLGDEYLWGRDLLVAPVLQPGAHSRRVYLPAGLWHDWWTGEQLAGPRWVDRPVELGTLPLFVRAGAILPLDPVRQYTSQPVTEPTTLRIHPGADGTFTLYDDDGRSLGYRDGSDEKTLWIRLHWDDSEKRLTLEPDDRMSEWPGGLREFVVELSGRDSVRQAVAFQGSRVEVAF